jgi:hypothetical protein
VHNIWFDNHIDEQEIRAIDIDKLASDVAKMLESELRKLQWFQHVHVMIEPYRGREDFVPIVRNLKIDTTPDLLELTKLETTLLTNEEETNIRNDVDQKISILENEITAIKNKIKELKNLSAV